jgi:hypothetical protein
MCCRFVRGFLRLQVCFIVFYHILYTKSHVLEYKTPEQISYHLNLFVPTIHKHKTALCFIIFSLDNYKPKIMMTVPKGRRAKVGS